MLCIDGVAGGSFFAIFPLAFHTRFSAHIWFRKRGTAVQGVHCAFLDRRQLSVRRKRRLFACPKKFFHRWSVGSYESWCLLDASFRADASGSDSYRVEGAEGGNPGAPTGKS